ncbi:MAG TPA: hypothetical protein VGZ22_19465 [Isosphaeraceae bacterium]|jgi:uncharacterized membrane protein|nr:hypothetical protein [Isosphaeraceae bacterium]
MTTPSLIWGSPQWMLGALLLMGAATAALLWSYGRAQTTPAVKLACAILKGLGFSALILSLLEPLLTGSRPRPGANAFVILADNSQSLLIRDDNNTSTRGDWMRDLLSKESAWKTRLGQDYDVRSYVFDSHMRAVNGFDALAFDGAGTSLTTSLSALAKRFRGLPLAGVLLLTDGNRTDVGDTDWSQLPPIYAVAPPSPGVAKDIGVNQISVSQTNFESAPVVIRADVSAVGFDGEAIVAAIVDEADKEVERQEARATGDGKPLSYRFQFRPEQKGVSFYRVVATAATDETKDKPVVAAASSSEQTLANNSRLVVIDQGGGPYRVLYVSGRPNWEFKFLRRAVADDEQVQLVGLVRIARRQPKFDFRNPRTQTTTPLFDGFDHPDVETAERFDQPVLVRLGTLDDVELRDGFPKAADELYRYHAVVIDDLEAGFFTQDQMTLLRSFVSQRGGGLLMLGGPDSFADGKYDRTPVGELLPVYLNRPVAEQGDQEYRLALTREGWLQPWVRTRKTEEEERLRLTSMSTFHTLSHVGNVKPGAVVLSQVLDSAGETAPALVAQQFGKGHVAALLIGDLWRWGMRRDDPTESDLDRSWRQTVRWLVGDVPSRVEVSVRPKAESTSPAIEVTVRVRDAEYRPLDNAKVALKIKLPGGDDLTLDAEPDGREAGTYAATYVTKQPGAYRIVASATAPDGSSVGEREAGWAAQPAADEFARLEPDRELLKTIASKTHGEVVDGERLGSFVASLSSRNAPITEPWTAPLWHHPLYFLIAIVCLTAEWGLRRVNGLA